MTLQIDVSYIETATGETKYVDLGLDGNLAGVEVARHELWGAEIMDRLGLKLLPLLKHQDIFVSGAELNDLEREAQIIMGSISRIEAETSFRADTVAHRTQNILKAIIKAREVNGTLSIT